ncbi:MAG: hypothetical protein V3S51_00785 [Dehalococcoidia bacterium]
MEKIAPRSISDVGRIPEPRIDFRGCPFAFPEITLMVAQTI